MIVLQICSYCYEPVGHVVTGDLAIITLRSFIGVVNVGAVGVIAPTLFGLCCS